MRSFVVRFTACLVLVASLVAAPATGADEIGTFFAQSGFTLEKQHELARLVAAQLSEPSRENEGAIFRFFLVPEQSQTRDRIVDRSQRSLRVASDPGKARAQQAILLLAGSAANLLGAVGLGVYLDLELAGIAASSVPSAYLFMAGMFTGLAAYLKTEEAQRRDWGVQMSRFQRELAPFFHELDRLGWRLESHQKEGLASRVFRMFTHPCQVSLGGIEELIRG